MEKHYFTFGTYHALAGCHQEITANTPDEAREEMFSLHGRDWAFQYTQAEWDNCKANGFFKNSRPLIAE